MMVARMLEVAVDKMRAIFAEHEVELERGVSPEGVDAVCGVVRQAVEEAAQASIKVWFEQQDVSADTLEHDGQVFRFKLVSDKEFLTPVGPVTVSRRLYQPDLGGVCRVPLDEAAGLVGQFATIGVRDAVLFAVALVTPQETEELLGKCGWFRCHATAIKSLAAEMGTWLEERGAELLDQVRADEAAMLPAAARVLVASLDGANVLLNEPGVKKGRPAERPVDPSLRRSVTGDPGPTCYKNATVGVISLYGTQLDDQGRMRPDRLVSRYCARMPEDEAVTLKEQLERELAATETALKQRGQGVVKIALADGARPLWNYLDSSPQFRDYERAVDFHHTCEHLSRAAEALFGKGTPEAQAWYDHYRESLQTHDDGADRVLRSMAYYARTRRLKGVRRADLSNERTFFRRNRARMPYARFLRNGWPIGSGPVEAACKTLVKTRLCRSGMRWSRRGGQHILWLRTFAKSQRWNALWKHYTQFIAA